MVTLPDQLSASVDFTADIERLASTPDDRAEHLAQVVRVMCADLAVPDSSMATLRLVRTARALASAVKAVWLASGTSVQPALQANLTDLITTVEEQHCTAGTKTARLNALTTLDPIIECASVRPGLVWSNVTPALPPVVPPRGIRLVPQCPGPHHLPPGHLPGSAGNQLPQAAGPFHP